MPDKRTNHCSTQLVALSTIYVGIIYLRLLQKIALHIGTDETELKLALSAVTIRFIRGIVPLQVHSRVTPAPLHSTPLISIIWNGANRYSVPKRSCGQKKISFRLKNIESGNVQK